MLYFIGNIRLHGGPWVGETNPVLQLETDLESLPLRGGSQTKALHLGEDQRQLLHVAIHIATLPSVVRGTRNKDGHNASQVPSWSASLPTCRLCSRHCGRLSLLHLNISRREGLLSGKIHRDTCD